MQRMLVGLVLFLTAAVGLLGIMVYNLSRDMDAVSRRRVAAGGGRRAADEGVDPTRVASLEGQLADLSKQYMRLRKEWEKERKAGARLPSENRASGAPADDARLPDPEPRSYDGAPGEPQRDPDGAFLISDEEEEYFMAVQKRVERRRRIDGMTKNLMRRVERMVGAGEIQTLRSEDKNKLERIVRRYVVAGDDLVNRYVREQPDDVAALSSDDKRNALREGRDALSVQAQEELIPLLGAEDAAKVAEKTFQNPWGGRFGSRRSTRLNRR
ncbi:MAG: hypothetical protein ACYSUN_10710 [Planctomycetota bacterium]|jgi:hypothetical protein